MAANDRLKRVFILITLYSIAMAYLESAVVVYLREIYYPAGFDFPMKMMSDKIMLTEILREAATLLMLIAIAYMSALKPFRRFAWFLYAFALWDIFYYVFLKILLNWPESLMTWDILFLIPVVWTGPVLAPLISSITMIVLAWLLLTFELQTRQLHIKEIAFLILAGALLVFVSYIYDFIRFTTRYDAFLYIFKPGQGKELLQHYIPLRFNWLIFISGELLMVTGMVIFYIESRIIRKNKLVI